MPGRRRKKYGNETASPLFVLFAHLKCYLSLKSLKLFSSLEFVIIIGFTGMDFLRKKNGERKGRKGGEVLSGDDGGSEQQSPIGAFPGDPVGGSFYAPSGTGGSDGEFRRSAVAAALKDVGHAFFCRWCYDGRGVVSFPSRVPTSPPLSNLVTLFCVVSWLFLPSLSSFLFSTTHSDNLNRQQITSPTRRPQTRKAIPTWRPTDPRLLLVLKPRKLISQRITWMILRIRLFMGGDMI